MTTWLTSLRRRPRTVAAVAAVAVLAAIGLAFGLSWGGSGSAPLSWKPTESRKPVRTVTITQARTYTFAQAVKAGVTPSLKEQELESGLPLCGTKPPSSGKARAAYERAVKRNDGDTCMADPREATYVTAGTIQSFFALNSVPNGHDAFRYVDSDGWAIVYARGFHGVAFSTGSGTAAGEDDALFANFTPVPTSVGPPVPPDGVMLGVKTTWNHVVRRRLGHDSRFPLRLPAAFEAHATGSMQTADFDFQGNGVAYHASVLAGPKAKRADLEAVARMVESISFPPAGVPGASASRSRRGS